MSPCRSLSTPGCVLTINIPAVQEYIGERRVAQKESLEGNIGDLKLECEGIVADLRSTRYATFQQDVDTIVEDLEERVAHIHELVATSEKFRSYCEDFGLPEVRSCF